MLRILVVALCLACASAFNVVGTAALRSAQPTLAVSMKAAAAPKSEKELRAEAIAKARAELAAAEAERAAALAEKEAALAALKKKGSAPARKAPEFKAPSFSVPSISLPKFSMPSGGSSTPGANAAVDLSNPAVKALVAGAAVGLAPAGAIISLRSFLDVSSTLEKAPPPAEAQQPPPFPCLPRAAFPNACARLELTPILRAAAAGPWPLERADMNRCADGSSAESVSGRR